MQNIQQLPGGVRMALTPRLQVISPGRETMTPPAAVYCFYRESLMKYKGGVRMAPTPTPTGDRAPGPNADADAIRAGVREGCSPRRGPEGPTEWAPGFAPRRGPLGPSPIV